jgi:gamma-glutamyltranspeptidase/glutathione hydrolase
VPLDILLSEEYAQKRRKLVNMSGASSELTPGSVANHPGAINGSHDTVHLDTVDKEGYMVSATQSGAWISSSPLIEGLGFPLGTRAQMFYLDPARNNSLSPGKRPRTTLTPSLVLSSDGRPLVAFGTPGGDMQDQWTLQFYLNMVEFGMNMQEAVEAPLMHSLHFPSSFYPREAFPRRIVVEDRINVLVIEELRRRGHDVEVVGPWGTDCRVTAVGMSPGDGTVRAAASPRIGLAYAIAW